MTADDRTVHQRMVAILSDLPAIGKDQKNVQQNFMFRGHDDVLNALNPLLAKHGVFVVPTVLERTTSERTTASGKAMFEVSLLVQYTFYGLAGDSVTASSWGEGTDMGDKATSKAMTMAFKSVLNQAFAISNKETADPDALTAEETRGATQAATESDAPSPVQMATTTQVQAIEKLIAQLNESNTVTESVARDQMKFSYKTEVTAELTRAQAGELQIRLEKAAKKLAGNFETAGAR